MAEPTQGNPTPPNNQDGLAPQNASKSLDKFFGELDALRKMIEDSKKTLEKHKKLQADLNKAAIAEQKARSITTESMKKLDEETEKFRDSQGKWLPETEAIQEKYRQDIEELSKAHKEAEDSFFEVSDALITNSKAIGDEKDARMTALFGLRDLGEELKKMDPSQASDYAKAYREASNLVYKSNKELENANSSISKVSGEELEKALGELAAGLRKTNASQLQDEAIEKEKHILEANKAFAEETNKLADELSTTEIAAELGKSGGIVGLSDIKSEVDALSGLSEKAVALYKTRNKEASDSDIKKYKETFIHQQKSLIQSRLEQKFAKELDEQRNKRILKIMEEQKVSRSVATKIDKGSKESTQADADTIKRHKETIDGLSRLNSTQLGMLGHAKSSDIKLAEKEAEAANDIPRWAQLFVDEIASLKDTMGGMFKKEDGWFKTIILILTVAVGTVIGYIFAKVAFIFNIIKGVFGLLTHLPFGIGKAISGVFGKLGGLGGGIAKMFSGVVSKLGMFGKGISTIFPFLGRLGSAFKFGFVVLGKFFFYVQLAIDAIWGAYKGFQQLGNIKGLITGALAQMISGLTFGLLDFQSIFDFFNTTMGGVFDGIAGVFEPIVEFFKKVYKNSVDAFSRIFAIFQGEGSIFSKIFSAVQVGISAMMKNVVALIGTAIKTAVKLFIVLPFKIGEFIGEMIVKLAELTYAAFMSLWDWIASGRILADVVNFGSWLYDQLVGFFAGIIDAIADGLGEIPIVGGYIKEALGGGAGGDGLQVAVEKSAEVVKEAQRSANKVAETATGVAQSGAVQYTQAPVTPIATPSGSIQYAPMQAPSYSANTVNTATNNTSTAKMNAMNNGGTAVVNTPTTNNIMNGGGGESNMLMPTNNRNTEPTLRALLFQECPAL